MSSILALKLWYWPIFAVRQQLASLRELAVAPIGVDRCSSERLRGLAGFPDPRRTLRSAETQVDSASHRSGTSRGR
jgi:hypothetical protein